MIEVAGLRKTFRSAARWREILRGRLHGRAITALDGVDLQVARDEIVGVMGPNGAGKSTLLRILAGLIEPSGGKSYVDGSVAFVVADERSFSWRLSGRHNLEFFASLYGFAGADARDRVAHALARASLGTAADRPYREYSTGMRQRLALARGLLADADVFLLDEPTRGVDPEAARVLRRFIRDQLGRTVLLTTHDLHEARELCARVAILRAGRIEQTLAPDDVARVFTDREVLLA